MGMTNEEKRAKREIIKRLIKDGYRKYAALLDGRDLDTNKKVDSGFDLNLTRKPGVTAYIQVDKGRIVINRLFDIEAVSVVIRHELLHGFLQHQKRLINHVAQSRGLDPDKLDDLTQEELKNYIYSSSSPFNVVADFEISNRGYTDKDKDIIRNMVLDGEIISGLVTEDHFEDWTDLSLEEMWDKAMEERSKIIQKLIDKQMLQGYNNDGSGSKDSMKPQFIDGSLSQDGLVFVDENGVEYGF